MHNSIDMDKNLCISKYIFMYYDTCIYKYKCNYIYIYKYM